VSELDENGKHRLFAASCSPLALTIPRRMTPIVAMRQLMAAIWRGASKCPPAIGMNTHFGYAYSPWPSVTFSLRYRAIVMADIYDGLRISSRDIVWHYSRHSLVHGSEFYMAHRF
jgi:hypothetical protein